MLEALRGKYACIREVRGMGLLLAVELHSGELAERVLYECLRKGLSFKISGGKTLSLSPPLIITDEQMAQAIGILDAAMGKAGAE